MYLILHLIILGLAVLFMVLGSVLKRSGDYYLIESILYPFLAMILFAALSVSGVVDVWNTQPIIANITNTSTSQIYAYSTWTHIETYPIYPINLVYLLLAIINLLLVFYRSFQALRG